MPNPALQNKGLWLSALSSASISLKSEQHMIVALVWGGEETEGLWVLMVANQGQIQ